MIRQKWEKQPRRRTIGDRSKVQVERVREGVYLRDDYRCLAAGSWGECAGRITIQHAISKGMGGSAEFDEPALLRTFCIGHNVLETSSAEFRQYCLRMGWSLHRNRANPERVPVRYPDGHDYLLFNTGFGRALLTVDEAAELRALAGMEGVA